MSIYYWACFAVVFGCWAWVSYNLFRTKRAIKRFAEVSDGLIKTSTEAYDLAFKWESRARDLTHAMQVIVRSGQLQCMECYKPIVNADVQFAEFEGKPWVYCMTCGETKHKERVAQMGDDAGEMSTDVWGYEQ